MNSLWESLACAAANVSAHRQVVHGKLCSPASEGGGTLCQLISRNIQDYMFRCQKLQKRVALKIL